MRKANVGRGSTLHLIVRYPNLTFDGWQTKMPYTALCGDIAKTAYDLFCKRCPIGTSIRLIGVTVSGFDYHIEQIRLDDVLDGQDYEREERMESAVEKIRKKYGYATLQRGLVMEDEKLNGLDIRGKKEED